MLTILVAITLADPGKNLFKTSDLALAHSSNAPVFTIPTRTISGTAFGNSIMNVGPTEVREDLTFAQYLAGNIPDFMRNPIPITVIAGSDTLTYWVLPDVLSVGTDADYLRTSLNPLTAKKVADLYGCVLPTKKMAYQIWQAATVKLNPNTNGAPYDATMMSTERMIFHNGKIQAALTNKVPGELVTGHKKDVVISTGLFTSKNVAIVGWWYPSYYLG